MEQSASRVGLERWTHGHALADLSRKLQFLEYIWDGAGPAFTKRGARMATLLRDGAPDDPTRYHLIRDLLVQRDFCASTDDLCAGATARDRHDAKWRRLYREGLQTMADALGGEESPAKRPSK